MPCRQSPHLQLSLARRVVIFIVGAVESMLFAGTVFGWPQLVHLLKVEGLYSDLCDGRSSYSSSYTSSSSSSSSSSSNLTRTFNITALHGPGTPPHPIFNNTQCFSLNNTYDVSRSSTVGVEQCEPQDERFALIFTMTVCFYSLSGIPVGYLLHHIGLRVTRISGGSMMTLSFLFLSIATRESPNWLFPAMILMGLGGNQVRMAVMQLSDLFPDHRSTALTLLSGIYAASAALFLIFQYMAEVGIAKVYSCLALAGVSIVTTLASFIMPVHHIPIKATTVGDHEARPFKALPLSKSLRSASSLLHQYWFFMCLFAINVYQQNYNVWINQTSCTVEETGRYSALFSFSNLITVFIAPLGGVFTDFMVRRANKTSDSLSRRVKEVQASFWPLLVTTVATLILNACRFFLHPAAVYVSLVCMVIARPCVIAVSTAFIRIRFPADHFNRLMGIYATVMGILTFLQYPHFLWEQRMPYAANMFLLALMMLCVMYPVHLLFTPLIRQAVLTRDHLVTSESLMSYET